MARYEKGTMGKIIVQDWDVLVSYPDELVLRWISPRQSAALIALAEFMAWKTRYSNAPAQDVLDAFEAETRYNLMTDVAFCALMINCINNDIDVQQALAAWLISELQTNVQLQEAVSNANYYNNGRFPPNPATTGNILGGADCIKDNAAGFVKTGIVDMSCELIYDMLNALEAASNESEITAAFIDAVPVLGELLDGISVQDVFEFAGNVGDWIAETFEAEDTIARREETYKDLLCLYMQDCSLSIDQIRDYFWQKATQVNAGFNDALGTAVDLYNFLLNQTVTSFEGIWYVMHATNFGGAYFLNSLFGMTLELFKLQAQRGEPTDDWIVWEALYGGCECYEYYEKPDHPVPDLTVSVGYIGIVDSLAASQVYTPNPSGFVATPWIITDLYDVPMTNAIGVSYVTDTPNEKAIQFYFDTYFMDNEHTKGVYVGEGLYEFRLNFPAPFTGSLVKTNFRNLEGDMTDFLWKQIRIYTAC